MLMENPFSYWVNVGNPSSSTVLVVLADRDMQGSGSKDISDVQVESVKLNQNGRK